MNYKQIYENLMISASEQPKSDTYKERHHIVPVCMDGSDDKENLVKLTARQHYLAHWLLYKIYGTTKLVHAWYGMSRIGNGQDARKQNSHLFEKAKKQRSQRMSTETKGPNNNFYGKKHTQTTIDKIKEARELQKNDPELHAKWLASYSVGVSKKWKGVPKSPESNILRARKGMIMLRSWIEPEKIVRVYPDKREEYPEHIWVNPWKVTCKMKKMSVTEFWNIDPVMREECFSKAQYLVEYKYKSGEVVDVAIEIYLEKMKNENSENQASR